MRIARVQYNAHQFWAMLEPGSARFLRQPPFGHILPGSLRVPLSKVRLLAPCEPSKIVLAGLNYRDHARELGMAIPAEPVIFLKPPTAVIGPGDPIIWPRGVKRLDYEAELAVVIGRTAREITPGQAPRHILGYTCLNDVTARDLQKKDGQWTRAKSFDTFCPIGPWIETDLDIRRAAVSCRLNGRLKQSSDTSKLIFGITELVSFVSRVMTLLPGDIISTGTPPGIAAMKAGDTVEISIEGIGTLVNRVQRPNK